MSVLNDLDDTLAKAAKLQETLEEIRTLTDGLLLDDLRARLEDIRKLADGLPSITYLDELAEKLLVAENSMKDVIQLNDDMPE